MCISTNMKCVLYKHTCFSFWVNGGKSYSHSQMDCMKNKTTKTSRSSVDQRHDQKTRVFVNRDYNYSSVHKL